MHADEPAELAAQDEVEREVAAVVSMIATHEEDIDVAVSSIRDAVTALRGASTKSHVNKSL